MKNRRRSGFTLIEIAVVLGIIIALGAIVLVDLSGRRSTTDLTSTSEKITATLREAQSDSMAQKNGLAWGVRFAAPVGTSPFYALFSGSYSASNVVGQYSLPSDVQYSASSVTPGSFVDVIFAQVTGIPSASATIILDLVTGGGTSVSVSSTLVRQSSGKVFFDNFTRSVL